MGGYDEIVVLRDIRFESHCEHHIAPIIGRVHIGYLPRNRVIGISKLARLVDVYSKRLQVQEKMTAEIAGCLNSVLKPFGVGVVVEGAHECMTTRGVHKSDVTMVTSCMLGTFRTRPETRQEFLSAINLKGGFTAETVRKAPDRKDVCGPPTEGTNYHWRYLNWAIQASPPAPRGKR